MAGEAAHDGRDIVLRLADIGNAARALDPVSFDDLTHLVGQGARAMIARAQARPPVGAAMLAQIASQARNLLER